jgi:hypothetical protein
MTDHDRLFKELLTTFFIEFLELFLPDVAAFVEPDSIEFLDKEAFTDVTSGEKYEADIVARVRFRGREAFFIIHEENQSYDQAGFPRRMFHYFARFDAKYGLPVYPIALFTYDTPLRQEPNTYEVTFPNRTVMRYEFDAIQLNRLDWRDYINRTNPVAAALMAKMKIVPSDRPKVKAQCLRLLLTLRLNPAKMQLIFGFVDSYLRLNRQEEQVLAQELAAILPPTKQEEAMEIITSYEERGRQQGMLILTQKLLNHKLGVLTPEIKERLTALTTEQLEDMGEVLLDFQSSEDLTAWLDSHTEKPRRRRKQA